MRRQLWISLGIATLLAVIALLLLPPHAHGNFVYWTIGSPGNSLGRAKISGTGLNKSFVTSANEPRAVAVDSHFVYWTQGDATTGSIGRANLDGSGSNQNFIPHSAGVNDPRGIAVTPTAIYWSNGGGGIGRANLDGSGPVSSFITSTGSSCELAADSSFLYFLTNSGLRIGRATLSGSSVDPNFVTIPEAFCGPAGDPSFLYWASDSGNTVGRVPVGGGAAQPNFIAAGTSGGGPSSVAVNSQYVFWGNYDTGAIGRANINGNSVNPALISGAGPSPPSPSIPFVLAAAPSNKITINSITRKKKKGTATINAKVPGPGQVGLQNTAAPITAGSAKVKLQGLTLTAASSFKLAVKPKGKTAKQLKKKGKAKATVWVTFVPSGVAGVESSKKLTIHLVKQHKKKH